MRMKGGKWIATAAGNDIFAQGYYKHG